MTQILSHRSRALAIAVFVALLAWGMAVTPATAAPLLTGAFNTVTGKVGFTVSMTSGSSITTSPITIEFNGGVANQSYVISVSPAGGSSTILTTGTTDSAGAFLITFNLPSTLSAGDYELHAEGAGVGGVSQVVATFSVASTSIVTNTSPTDGPLELVLTSDSVATFGTPSLTNNRSETLGAIGAFTVSDQRTVSKPGWTLTANVSQFTNSVDSAVTIPATNLGMAPSISAGSTASGVVLQARTAGAASYPYTLAEASAGQGVGETILTTQLLLLSPQDKPAGTYRSTLTLTLVSK